jgi:hypothetical protein
MDIIENFSLDLIKSLSQNQAKEYLTKYFIPLTNGNHAFLVNGKYEIYETKVIKSTYFNRMSKELNEYYFKIYTSIKRVSYKLNGDLFIGNDELNLCPKMLVKQMKPYIEYDEEIKNGVDFMLQFIKEVLASDNDESYKYLIKWLANMMQGNKNDTCLYLKGQQGIGKSTLFEFLKDFVIGNGLLLETGSEPLKSNFNSILGGKLLVVFEELENFSLHEWIAISSRLKRYITSTTYNLEKKGIDPYETENINNYVINSNNDAIKDDDGRRYFILDVSHKYKGNKKYFGKLRATSFNQLVGEAFYTYMLEIDTKGFIPQDFPVTKSKLNSFAKRLDREYEFIKEQFILKRIDLNHKPKELYELYKQFCNMKSYKSIDKYSFSEKLESVGLTFIKTLGTNYLKYSVNNLIDIANKNKWLHELDETKDNNDDDIDDIANYDNIIECKNNEIKNLSEALLESKKEIDELKKLLEEKKVIKKVFKKIVKKVNPVVPEINLINDNPPEDLFAEL